jgi:ribosomal protein S18 acetylase RimI-like enzyme
MSQIVWEIVDVTENTIEEYGLFCHKSRKKEKGYQDKLKWIKDRFKEGMKYKILLVEERGKMTSRGFIEYIPGDHCWRGVSAKGYMFIHCIWIVGKYKGHGFGSKFLEECVNDSREMNGVAVMTAKTTWLPKSKLFIKHGFEKTDDYPPSFELYVKRFVKNAPLPKFNKFQEDTHKGFVIYYAYQCPYTYNMLRSIEKYGEMENIPVTNILIEDCKKAQKNVHPYGTSCYLLNGQILTYHSDKINDLVED